MRRVVVVLPDLEHVLLVFEVQLVVDALVLFKVLLLRFHVSMAISHRLNGFKLQADKREEKTHRIGLDKVRDVVLDVRHRVGLQVAVLEQPQD